MTALSHPLVGPLVGPLCIAIVGAESTGKTTLAREIAWTLAGGAPAVTVPGAAVAGAGRVALVGEVLREWCDAAGRTPRREEQRGILIEQHRRIDAAAATHDIVVCDTTALMTHVYSDLLFDDRSLLPLAVQRHRGMGATLLTALDLPWVADGHQRDGEHVRQPVDDRVREVLQRHGIPFAVVAGTGSVRLGRALAALRPLLAATPGGGPVSGAGVSGAEPGALPPAGSPLAEAPPTGAAGTAGGLFTRLQAGHAVLRRLDWVCECCVPGAEQALLRQREAARGETAATRVIPFA